MISLDQEPCYCQCRGYAIGLESMHVRYLPNILLLSMMMDRSYFGIVISVGHFKQKDFFQLLGIGNSFAPEF